MALCFIAPLALADDDYPRIGKDARWNHPRPDMPDLSVQFITRSPHYAGLSPEYTDVDDPVAGEGPSSPIRLKGLDGIVIDAPSAVGAASADATRAALRRIGWPKPGEQVKFTATVRNVGTRPVGGFDWAWLYDGKEVATGRFGETSAAARPDAPTFLPDDTLTFELERPWEDGPHSIAFLVDRDRLVDEISADNNAVIDRTDALALTFFVEERVARFFQTVQSGLNSYSFEDWAQFQIREMNREFRDTIYPTCPDGIIERVRLDRVYRIPDGWGAVGGMHTPNVLTPVDVENPQFVSANEKIDPGVAENFNNVNGGVDGVWGFTVDLLAQKSEWGGRGFYEHHSRWLTGPEWPLHHEIGHQLGRADHYLLPTSADANDAAPGLAWQPPRDYQDCMMFTGNHAHDGALGRNQEKWDSTYRFYSEHLAASFNRDKGIRRGLFGEYLLDVPTRNEFLILDPRGDPIRNARVELFVARGRGYTNPGFNSRPDFAGRTDAGGLFRLDRNPWRHIFIWATNGVLMFRVSEADPPLQRPESSEPRDHLVGFLDISRFNLACWSGRTDPARHTVKVAPWRAPSATSQPAPMTLPALDVTDRSPGGR